jgi:hypothetical protein
VFFDGRQDKRRRMSHFGLFQAVLFPLQVFGPSLAPRAQGFSDARPRATALAIGGVLSS